MSFNPSGAPAALIAAAVVALSPCPTHGQAPVEAPAPATPAPAAESKPAKLLEVSLNAVYFDYEERMGGVFLDGETGLVPGLGVAFQVEGKDFFGQVTGRLAKGTVDYDGHVQTSDPLSEFNGLDVKTTTGTTFLQGELLAGAFLEPSRRFSVIGAVGKRRWGRSIRAGTVTAPSGATATVSGLDETYDWWELQAGLRATVVRRSTVVVLLEGRVVRTAAPRMTLDLSSIGGSGEMTFDLGARGGFRLSGGGRFALSPTLLLTVGAHAEWYAFGQSDVNAAGFMEPPSTTRNVGVDVGLAFPL